ncbi:MAG: tetratricopeptide repeat-containing serine protease family protein [Rudaea sp.]|uniref:trypsin-like peptidase domain-containing protein n=1 Tax=Rudaea sp. TaxID=2136325 RepID=UPI0039E65E8D
MYENGIGVPKNQVTAFEWLKKAARQGNSTAQAGIGWDYSNGVGTAADSVLAYAWFNIAALQGDVKMVADRDSLEAKLSPQELSEAQRLSSSWHKGMLLTRGGTVDKRSEVSGGIAANGSSRHIVSTGTVFVVSSDGRGVTNHHVVDGCTELKIAGREGLVQRLTDDSVNDLALVALPGNIGGAATIVKEPSKLRQGDEVVVFGFPLNTVLSSGGNLTPGVVSAIAGLANNTNQIQITAPIQPGSSGSPVLNKRGEVVGVVSMKLSEDSCRRRLRVAVCSDLRSSEHPPRDRRQPCHFTQPSICIPAIACWP